MGQKIIVENGSGLPASTPSAGRLLVRTDSPQGLAAGINGTTNVWFPSITPGNSALPANSYVTTDGNGNLTTNSTNLVATTVKITTPPTANSTGTVVIIAKDSGVLTNNAGWLTMIRSDGTTVYIPYWI